MVNMEELYLKCLASEKIFVDTETSGLDWLKCDLKGVGLCNLTSDRESTWAQWVPGDEFKEYSYVFEDVFEKKPIVMHNAKFDMHVLARHVDNKVLENMKVIDTMIMAALIDENTSHKLKDLVSERYHITRDEEHVLNMTPEELEKHCLLDVIDTMSLYRDFEKEISEMDLEEALNVENETVKVLWGMEERGVLIDREYLLTFREQLLEEMSQIQAHFPEGVNLVSPTQCGKYLFETLGLKAKGFTASGKPSTDEKYLSLMTEPAAKDIIRFREASHTLSTFVDAYLAQADSSDRLHCEFKQLGARTGRMSCKKPNLQQVLKEENVRRIFIGRKNLLAADYSQMEAVLYAHVSNDATFAKLFEDHPDVYAVFASEIFNLPIEKVFEPCVITPDKTYRSFAKGIVLGMMYGMGEKKFRALTGEELFPELIKRFPVLYNYGRAVSRSVEETGYVKTLLGRYRHLFPSDSYKGVNAKIQGSASDIVKVVMISLPKDIQRRLLLQVHDELLFEDIEPDEVKIIRECMTDFNFKVRLKATIGVGKNWWEASQNAVL